MKEHQKKVINKYLSKLYGDLVCVKNKPTNVSWHTNRKHRVIICRDSDTLFLSYNDIEHFVGMFSLSYQTEKDQEILLELILPHLKFKDGTPAIPELMEFGFIEELSTISVFDWD